MYPALPPEMQAQSLEMLYYLWVAATAIISYLATARF